MERNNTTINVSLDVRDKINQLRIKWKLKTQNDVLEIVLKNQGGKKQ